MMFGVKVSRFFATTVALCLVVAIASSAGACVGKTLVIGSKGTAQQDILAEMLSILIVERTGTTVKVVKFDSTATIHDALLKADLDMYIEYTGVGQVEVLQKAALADPAALYQTVKATYNQDLNLVWLKPLGFNASDIGKGDFPAEPAPVVRKDTLKKFPALARLINKLGGAISVEAMHDLEQQVSEKSPRDVARQFLKAGRFI